MAARLTRIFTAFSRLNRDLDAIGARWSLVGGLAVGVRGEPRTTRDIDVAIDTADDAEAEAVVRALVHRGYGLHLVLEHATTHRLATVRLLVPARGRRTVIADLLFTTSSLEGEAVRTSTRVAVGSLTAVPVASLPALVAMKLLSESDERPRDRQDLVDLLSRATPAENAECQRLVNLATERRAHRGRDLESSLRHFRELAERSLRQPGSGE